MTTVFGEEGKRFWPLLYESDVTKRHALVDLWVEEITPVLQNAVKEELKASLEFLNDGEWKKEGWKPVIEKLPRAQNNWLLVMDIQLRTLKPREKFRGNLPTPVFDKSEINVGQNSVPQNRTNSGADDDYGDSDDEGRSANDDRSDSMNPNNDSYHASMDNHSNQMNSNNDAYWSSRGR